MKFSKTKSKYHENIFPLSFIMVLMDNTTCSYRKRGEACERELGLRGFTRMRTLSMSCGRGRGSQEWIGSHKGSYKGRPPDMPVLCACGHFPWSFSTVL